MGHENKIDGNTKVIQADVSSATPYDQIKSVGPSLVPPKISVPGKTLASSDSSNQRTVEQKNSSFKPISHGGDHVPTNECNTSGDDAAHEVVENPENENADKNGDVPAKNDNQSGGIINFFKKFFGGKR
ncbi:MAG: hypothetical protein LBR91_01715 [Puniceicoccales bacterium]|jgi:hypothetical protein|nr:hypothetical protein [Puniceicoccales bacterium]